MGINKMIYNGEVKFDLTGDTITPDKVLKGYTGHDKAGNKFTGTCDFDSNTEDATIAVAEMIEGKTAYARGTKLTGSMPNNGAVKKVISSKDEVYTIPQGYHDGSGTVGIDETEKSKLIPANIREGVTILNVKGSMSELEGSKPQTKEVAAPLDEDLTVLPDEGFTCLSQVTIKKVPYVESDNSAGGTTITIG